MARGDGTVYFMSPELLDGAGTRTSRTSMSSNQVARLISSAKSTPAIGKPPPAPPAHPVVSTNFVTGLSQPEGLAVDQETDAIYAAETGAGGRIARFDATGAPLKFTEGPGAGTNRIPNSGLTGTEAGIAVDSSGGVLDGAIYAIHGYGSVAVYSRGGAMLGELTGFGEACGVAVNQNTGEVIVGDYSYGGMYRFTPVSGATPVSKANYTEDQHQDRRPEPVPRRRRHRRSRVRNLVVDGAAEEVQHLRLRGLTVPTNAGTEVAGTSLRGLERPGHR